MEFRLAAAQGKTNPQRALRMSKPEMNKLAKKFERDVKNGGVGLPLVPDQTFLEGLCCAIRQHPTDLSAFLAHMYMRSIRKKGDEANALILIEPMIEIFADPDAKLGQHNTAIVAIFGPTTLEDGSVMNALDYLTTIFDDEDQTLMQTLVEFVKTNKLGKLVISARPGLPPSPRTCPPTRRAACR